MPATLSARRAQPVVVVAGVLPKSPPPALFVAVLLPNVLVVAAFPKSPPPVVAGAKKVSLSRTMGCDGRLLTGSGAKRRCSCSSKSRTSCSKRTRGVRTKAATTAWKS